MKNVSNQFKEIIKRGGPFYAYAEVTLKDGTELTLDSKNDFYQDGNSYSESGGDGFPLGVALSKTIDIGLENIDERFSEYDFYYARITFYTEADLPSGKTERIKEGTFTVINSVAPGDIIEISASDDMYKADIAYVPKVRFPATALAVLRDVCTQTGINLGSVTFTNQDFQILSAPEGITCRQAIGYIAQIAGGNAAMDQNNRLIIKTYNLPELDFIDIISGGFIGDSLNNKISGGIFGDNLKDYITAGEFGTNSDYVLLSEFSSDPEIATDDVVITAIETTGEKGDEEISYMYGEEGYVLAIENPLIKGAEEAAIKLIGDIIIGFRLRPFSGEFYPNPTLQFMDAVYLVDRKYNIYQTFITNHTFNYLGNSQLSNDTESPERNNSEYYSSATAAYRKAREELKRQKTEWEKAMEELKDRIDNSSGLYMTVKKQPDGSSIYYMHDKPTLEESMIVWKMTAEAFAVSSDGGKTYNAGLTVDGNLIAKILNTIGVNADWIRTGKLSANFINGGSLILGGNNNTNGILKILNSSGSQVGTWDRNGIRALSGIVGGWHISNSRITSSPGLSIGDKTPGMFLINESDKPFLIAQNSNGTTFHITRDGDAIFAGELQAATGTFKGELLAATGRFSGEITATSGKIGDWTIYNGNITNGLDFTDKKNTDATGMGKYGSNWAFWAGNGRFSVQQNGKLYASNADISGTITANAGKIGNWQIYNGNITNGLLYTGGKDSNATGMGEYGGNWAFWAGNGRFSVQQNGKLYASNADISGNVNASSGSFNSVSIAGARIDATNIYGGTHYSGYMNGGSLQGTISNTGALSGGAYSGGSLSSVGGTYIGTCSGSTLSSCTTGGSSLNIGSGNYIQSSGGAKLYGSTTAYVQAGTCYFTLLNSGSAIFGSDVLLHARGGLIVTGTKSRAMKTKNFGEHCLDAYETPLPTFADYGMAKTDDTGQAFIITDPIFCETIDKEYSPVVFLTKYSDGELHVDEELSTHDIIVVKGTPNLKFAWQTLYQQGNCYQERLRILGSEYYGNDEKDFVAEAEIDYEFSSIDYGEKAAEYLDLYNHTSVDYAVEAARYYEEFERGLVA